MSGRSVDKLCNRIAAWVIGTRATLQALLQSFLEPIELLREYESAGDFTARLAALENAKTMPFGAVWDYYCTRNDAPTGTRWMEDVRRYERDELSRR